MPPPPPNPQSLTLLLKSHRTTILLHTPPDISLSALQKSLHAVTSSARPETCPTSAKALLLARQTEEAGWMPLDEGEPLRLRDGEVLAWRVEGQDEEEWVVEEPAFDEDEGVADV
ncbi:hypothetical protein ANO11243_034060 [Dothideomycetidae sp. 11243]|nr:hypothetical protein ANO11243_034060 [fungal sp. No.11243]